MDNDEYKNKLKEMEIMKQLLVKTLQEVEDDLEKIKLRIMDLHILLHNFVRFK